MGDRRLYDEAVKRGSAHAWKGQWELAVREYRIALKQFPTDVSARSYLALALYKSGQLQESSGLYQQLWREQPSNLTALRRLAEVQEAAGEVDDAAASYGLLAEAHVRRGSSADGFDAWQKVVSLKPEDPQAWSSLVDAAEQLGLLAEVIPGYLGLARNLALGGRFEEAIQVVEKAQGLDPASPAMLPLLTSIRRAMGYWWRMAADGETPTSEELVRLIPPIQAAEQSPGALGPTAEGDGVPEQETVQAEAGHLPMSAGGLEAMDSVHSPVLPVEEVAEEIPPVVPMVEVASAEPAPAERGRVEDGRPSERPLEPVGVERVEGLETLPPTLPSTVEAETVLEEEPLAEAAAGGMLVAPAGEDRPDSEGVAGEQEAEEPASGIPNAEELVGLAEAQERLGQSEQALATYRQALELSPDLPRAILGLARIHLSTGLVDTAEEEARRVLECSSEETVVSGAAALLLDILTAKAVSGDLGEVAEGLAWLASRATPHGLLSSSAERAAATAARLLGRSGAEHLEELAALPREVRGGVILALRGAEEALETGRLRTAADSLCGLIAAHPDFLPPQSLLGRVLVARGRVGDAREKSRRLLELYRLRGTPRQSLEAEAWLQSWGALVRLAEARFRAGDRSGATSLLRAALEAEDAADGAVHTALVRVLQLMGDDGRREDLVESLKRLGVPEGLAN